MTFIESSNIMAMQVINCAILWTFYKSWHRFVFVVQCMTFMFSYIVINDSVLRLPFPGTSSIQKHFCTRPGVFSVPGHSEIFQKKVSFCKRVSQKILAFAFVYATGFCESFYLRHFFESKSLNLGKQGFTWTFWKPNRKKNCWSWKKNLKTTIFACSSWQHSYDLSGKFQVKSNEIYAKIWNFSNVPVFEKYIDVEILTSEDEHFRSATCKI